MTAAGRDLAAVGGPLGRHARARGFGALVWPFVLLAMVPLQLSMLQKSWCLERGWSGTDQFWRACFSDLPVQYQVGGLAGGLPAFLGGDAHAAHPPLTAAVMAFVGGLVGDGPVVSQQRQFFLLWAVLTAALLMGTVWLTAASRPRQASLAAHVALSPVVVTAAMVSSDVVGVALVSAGLLAWARRRPVLAGALLGLAVAARTYPVLLLLVLVLLGVRAGRLAPVRALLLGAAGAVAVVALVVGVGHPAALTEAYAQWWSAPAGLGSPWLVPQLVAAAGRADAAPGVLAALGNAVLAVVGHPLPALAVTVLSVLGIAAAVVAGALLVLTAPRRPPVALVGVVVVGIVLATGKSYPVQSALWLVPLVALAGLRWRDHLLWAGAEALNFVAVWLYSGGLSRPDRGLPPGWYALFTLVRLLGTAWLVRQAWRTAMALPAYEPDPDLPDDPDRDAVVDETAGPLAEAPDALVATYR